MGRSDKISVLQATFLMITVLGILDHVILMPVLLQTAGRDSWLSVLAAGAVSMLWIPLIYYVMKTSGQRHLLDWLKGAVGAPVAWIIIAFICLQMFAMGAMTLRDVSFWSNITYLPQTPNVVIVACLAAVSYWASMSGIRTIAIVNGILFPLVVALGFFVSASNLPHKDYSRLLPLFEHGASPIVSGIAYACSGLTGILMFTFMQHRLRSPMKLSSLFITGITLIGLTIGPLMGAISIFGPSEAARMRFPAYEEWRIVTFGHFLEHVDFLSIYQWLVGSFTRISIALFLIPDLLGIAGGRKRAWLLTVLFVLMVAETQIPLSDQSFTTVITRYYLPGSLGFFLVLMVLFGGVAWMTRKNGRVSA